MRVDPNFTSGLTGSLNSIVATEQKLTQQLSSGSRLSSLSDDSVAVSRAARLQSEFAQNESFISNATVVSSRMQAAEGAIGSVVHSLTTAISLATQVSNGTISTAAKASVLLQLQTVRADVLSAANTTFQEKPLFAGNATPASAFASNGSYNGDNGHQTITTPTGEAIQTSIPGSSVFSQAFTALDNAIQAVSSGGTPAAGELNSALSTVISQRASFNSSQASLRTATDASSQRKSQIQISQTELLSADAADVATKLSNTETQQKALLSVIAALGKSNLFDFM